MWTNISIVSQCRSTHSHWDMPLRWRLLTRGMEWQLVALLLSVRTSAVVALVTVATFNVGRLLPLRSTNRPRPRHDQRSIAAMVHERMWHFLARCILGRFPSVHVCTESTHGRAPTNDNDQAPASQHSLEILSHHQHQDRANGTRQVLLSHTSKNTMSDKKFKPKRPALRKAFCPSVRRTRSCDEEVVGSLATACSQTIIRIRQHGWKVWMGSQKTLNGRVSIDIPHTNSCILGMPSCLLQRDLRTHSSINLQQIASHCHDCVLVLPVWW